MCWIVKCVFYAVNISILFINIKGSYGSFLTHVCKIDVEIRKKGKINIMICGYQKQDI